MKLTLAFAALVSLSAYAAGPLPRGETLQKLFKVSNDRDEQTGRLSISYDAEGKATGVYLGLNKDGNDVEGDQFRLREIESSHGALLIEEDGYEALFLQGKFDAETQEGRFRFKYLANGLSKKYETCDFLLKRSGTNWFVQNAYTGRPVNEMVIDTYTFGIKTLEGICPK